MFDFFICAVALSADSPLMAGLRANLTGSAESTGEPVCLLRRSEIKRTSKSEIPKRELLPVGCSGKREVGDAGVSVAKEPFTVFHRAITACGPEETVLCSFALV